MRNIIMISDDVFLHEFFYADHYNLIIKVGWLYFLIYSPLANVIYDCSLCISKFMILRKVEDFGERNIRHLALKKLF